MEGEEEEEAEYLTNNEQEVDQQGTVVEANNILVFNESTAITTNAPALVLILVVV